MPTLSEENASVEFARAAQSIAAAPSFVGRGIIIAAGGPYLPSAYVAVRLLRHFGMSLPIELWFAGKDELPPWAEQAFAPLSVTFHDASRQMPDRPLTALRGWPLKSAALHLTTLREVMLLDADCFPLRNLEFLFETAQFRSYRAIFWPDNKRYQLVQSGRIWSLTGLQYQNDDEFESGLLVIDRTACWAELSLTEWMNARSTFWYQFVLGDKDTFYLAWRKRNRSYFLGPQGRRRRLIATRHFWIDGQPVVDHRCGASKYAVPRRRGPMWGYLQPYKWRSGTRNLLDEIFQRLFVGNFPLHAQWLRELQEMARHA